MKNITYRRAIWLLLSIFLYLGTDSNLAHAQAALPNLNPDGIEIVGGQDVPDPNPYVWQVSIGYRNVANEDDGNQGHFCGGSVIGDRWILTAAHCLTSSDNGDEDPATLRVIIGRRVRSAANAGIEINVESYTIHENYNENTNRDDIALIKLVTPIPNYETYVIPLMRSDQEAMLASAGTMATVSGWGGLQGYGVDDQGPPGGQTFPDVLQFVEVPILSQTACNQALQAIGGGSALSSNLCTGFPEGGKDSCQNDSGGPLVVPDGNGGYVQVGVVSYGIGCAAPNSPGVYGRVSSYIEWIEEEPGLTLPAATQTSSERYCNTAIQPNVTNTEHFQINYGTIPAPLTIEDYKQALEAAYQKHIVEYGWAEPPLCAGDLQSSETDLTGLTCFQTNPWGKYPVVIAPLDEGLYGYVTPGDADPDMPGSGDADYTGWLGDNPNTSATETYAKATCMVLNNDYSWDENNTPSEAMQGTIAHEYVHSIQIGIGDPPVADADGFPLEEDNMWFESHAAYFEQEFNDGSNTNHIYLFPDMGTVDLPKDPNDENSALETHAVCLGQYPSQADFHYQNWPFFQHIAENFGGANSADATNMGEAGENITFRLWENIAQGQRGLTALHNVLGGQSTLQTEYHNYAIATALMLDGGKGCGNGYAKPYCMEEGAVMAVFEDDKAQTLKPGPNGTIAAMSGSYTGEIADHYTANYIKLPTASDGEMYDIRLAADSCSNAALRASLVCDSGSGSTIMSFGDIVNGGQSITLEQQAFAGCASAYVVVTNEYDSGNEVDSCAVCGYELAVEQSPATPTPTSVPTEMPTTMPTETPTVAPTETPMPTATPTSTEMPTAMSTDVPTEEPTEVPTVVTETPIPTATNTPTEMPTATPTATYTPLPTLTPQPTYTFQPTYTPFPSSTPTPAPTWTPIPTMTPGPTWTPTSLPPTHTPLPTHTSTPTMRPVEVVEVPTSTPVPTNTLVSTNTPIPTNTLVPTNTPRPTNTLVPTNTPMPTNTTVPTDIPTPIPTVTLIPARLVGSVTANTEEIDSNEIAVWTIQVNNRGQLPAEDVTLCVQQPPGTEIDAVSLATGWTEEPVTTRSQPRTVNAPVYCLALGAIEGSSSITRLFAVTVQADSGLETIQEPPVLLQSASSPDDINISAGVGNNIDINRVPTASQEREEPKQTGFNIYLPVIVR